jgi:hypothetical protein
LSPHYAGVIRQMRYAVEQGCSSSLSRWQQKASVYWRNGINRPRRPFRVGGPPSLNGQDFRARQPPSCGNTFPLSTARRFTRPRFLKPWPVCTQGIHEAPNCLPRGLNRVPHLAACGIKQANRPPLSLAELWSWIGALDQSSRKSSDRRRCSKPASHGGSSQR